MNLTYEKPPAVEGALIVRLNGNLNAQTADKLWESASQQVDQGARIVVLDFARVTILTSAGIGMLVRLHTRLKGLQGGLAIFGCSDRIREIFAIVMLTEILKVCDTEAQAWAAIDV